MITVHTILLLNFLISVTACGLGRNFLSLSTPIPSKFKQNWIVQRATNVDQFLLSDLSHFFLCSD